MGKNLLPVTPTNTHYFIEKCGYREESNGILKNGLRQIQIFSDCYEYSEIDPQGKKKNVKLIMDSKI